MQEYQDKTGTMEKPDPMNMAFLEFPRALTGVASVTAFGAVKHARRGWQTFKALFGIAYHLSKIGRHLRDRELYGEINIADGGNLHVDAIAWNALALSENVHKLREQNLPTDVQIAKAARLGYDTPTEWGDPYSSDKVSRDTTDAYVGRADGGLSITSDCTATSGSPENRVTTDATKPDPYQEFAHLRGKTPPVDPGQKSKAVPPAGYKPQGFA